MIISHTHRFIFIKTRKTAGTSIEVFLARHCGEGDILTPIIPPVAPHEPRNHRGWFNPLPELWVARGRNPRLTLGNLVLRQRFANHLPAYCVRSRIPRSVFDSYFKFCVERNPWDKTISHYHMLRNQKSGSFSFDDYLASGQLCSDAFRYTHPRSGALLVDRVLKFERLDEELASICTSLGIPYGGTLEVRAKTEYRTDRRPYREVYSEKQRTLVQRAFAWEIEVHGYEF
jgi:hypothetical protein